MTMVLDHGRVSVTRKLRRAAAWPVYLLALILSYLSDAIGNLAVTVAGDDRP
jgi:hypothetical protein